MTRTKNPSEREEYLPLEPVLVKEEELPGDDKDPEDNEKTELNSMVCVCVKTQYNFVGFVSL